MKVTTEPTKAQAETDIGFFLQRGVFKLRKPPYKGIHSVYSKLNDALRGQFPDLAAGTKEECLAKLTKAYTIAREKGQIAFNPTKGGAMVYLPEDAPGNGGASVEAVGKLILG